MKEEDTMCSRCSEEYNKAIAILEASLKIAQAEIVDLRKVLKPKDGEKDG